MSSSTRESISEDLELLDRKLKQLKNEYDQYFLGSRPREPQLLRGEVQKLVSYYSNVPINQTALRFKFNNMVGRFFAFKRQWERVLRQIEEGTYERHVFRARMHERRGPRGSEAAAKAAPDEAGGSGPSSDVFDEYVSARRQCGEDVSGLTREKMAQLLERQETAIRARLGCDEVRFRVVVENGRTKLKASPVKQGGGGS